MSARPTKRTRDSEAGDEERPRKTLCSSEPDTRIILKYFEGEGDKKQEKQKEYWLYSQKLSSWSEVVDNAHNSETKEKVIEFQVTPEVFDLALNFLEDPTAARTMTVNEVFQVVGFYHKYLFTSGLKLCDHVLVAEFKKLGWDDQLKVAVVAHKYHLDEGEKLSIRRIRLMLKACAADLEEDGTSMSSLFSEKYIQTIHDLFIAGLFDDFVPVGTTKEELESACFPKFFCLHYEREWMKNTYASRVEKLKDAFATYKPRSDLDGLLVFASKTLDKSL